ncbi:hypothetical protein [Finegoldia magna]|uniref:hypothetical protein n=1 Tax=Finegoldia magna TaxID=1260 RepID=UPI002911449A|nr:hypothetical protein [Finegoldia magna]MDU5201132.1 hypothetical protein [Finegoldia magna]MDU6775732.1 hypothetical protein [Finegoldia magna]
MGENLEDLKEEYESLQTLLEAYNPWKGKDFDDLLDDFFEALKNDDKEFSWLKIDDKLYNELKDKKGKAVSIDYGIPSHVRGDIENGTLFLCLVNPNIDVKVAMCEACQMKNKEDIKKYLFDINSKGGILYKEIVELKGLKKLIGLEESDKDKNQEKNKIGYYTANYFYVILSSINVKKNKNKSQNKDNSKNEDKLKKALTSFENFCINLENDGLNKQIKEEKEVNKESLKYFVEISKNIVNLEAFPFRSSTPGFAIKEENAGNRFANCMVNSNSNVSMLSARIIIWKILEYIVNPKDNVKPVFIFRRFNRAWRPSIENVLRKDFFGKNKDDSVKEDKDDSVKEDKEINIAIDNIIKKLHEEFFYTIGPKDQDNMLKMGKNIYKNDDNIYEENENENDHDKENKGNKEAVFNEIIINALTPKKDKKENKGYE